MSLLLRGLLGCHLVLLVSGCGRKPAPAVPPSAPAAEAWPVYALPKALHAGRRPGRVAVSFPHLPEPTADPAVWRWWPTVPGRGPAHYEIRFAGPASPASLPLTVEGDASLEMDGGRRVGKVPGVVILERAALRSAP